MILLLTIDIEEKAKWFAILFSYKTKASFSLKNTTIYSITSFEFLEAFLYSMMHMNNFKMPLSKWIGSVI